ncbi:MAG: hypothetical protein HY681_01880, partial [Chloroflexi bacterium]|nr:hypothetical protein [Chloroflexota bacterium]
ATLALLAFALLMAWSMMPTKTEAAVTAQVAPPPTRFVEQAFTPDQGECAITHQKIAFGPITVGAEVRETEIFKSFSSCTGTAEKEEVDLTIITAQCAQPADLSSAPRCNGDVQVSVQEKP